MYSLALMMRMTCSAVFVVGTRIAQRIWSCAQKRIRLRVQLHCPQGSKAHDDTRGRRTRLMDPCTLSCDACCINTGAVDALFSPGLKGSPSYLGLPVAGAVGGLRWPNIALPKQAAC
jgi:hypothetical protein